MLLEDITEISIGVVLKRKEAKYQTNETYEYQIFNIKSYEEKIEYDLFYSNENLENFVAKKGDILFRLSFPIKVIEVDEEIEGKLVNNQYCIIRMSDKNSQTYNIDFIKWFLESNNAKQQFEKILIGTTIRSVPVVKLRKLKIPKINREEQEKISKVVNTWNREKYLYKKMIKEKEKYYNSIINRVINGGKNK